MSELPIITFVAPSGAGKNHIIRHVVSEHGHILRHAISCASRPSRKDEVHGREYWFVTTERFLAMKAANEFVESANVNEEDRDDPYGWRGTLKTEIAGIWDSLRIPICDLNPDGAMSIQSHYGERAKTIMINPVESKRIERLNLRDAGLEHSRLEIERRIRTGPLEIERARKGIPGLVVMDYDYTGPALNKIENLVLDWVRPFMPAPFKVT